MTKRTKYTVLVLLGGIGTLLLYFGSKPIIGDWSILCALIPLIFLAIAIIFHLDDDTED